MPLNIYRRHKEGCKHRDKGAAYTKCACPIWVDGELHGRRYRKSLGVRDWQRAMRKLAALESPDARPSKTVAEAIQGFHDAMVDLAPSTMLKNRRTLRLLGDLAAGRGVRDIEDVTAEDVDALRSTRSVCALTWSKELAIVKCFFRFCKSRKWIEDDPSEQVKMPRGLKPSEKTPYTPEEVARILGACDFIGRMPYERLRARAMVLLLRYTALRVSDVALLERSRIHDSEIFVRTEKSGKPVRLPVYPELQAALDALPAPRGCSTAEIPQSRYFFWSGHGSKASMIRDATRTMTVVFRASGVAGAHAHRYRHTLASEILERGGSLELAADILGNTPALIAKHYGKWTPKRQQRVKDILGDIFGTNLVQKKKTTEKSFGIH
jgi:site-specific recombinase XerD